MILMNLFAGQGSSGDADIATAYQPWEEGKALQLAELPSAQRAPWNHAASALTES